MTNTWGTRKLLMVNEDVVRCLQELHLAFLHLASCGTQAEAAAKTRSEQALIPGKERAVLIVTVGSCSLALGSIILPSSSIFSYCLSSHRAMSHQMLRPTKSSTSRQSRRVGRPGQGIIDANRKTEICRHWRSGSCPFGAKCAFAHGVEELRQPSSTPDDTYIHHSRVGRTSPPSKIRQYPCLTWVATGSCPYDSRCTFLHDPRLRGASDTWLHASSRASRVSKASGVDVPSVAQRRKSSCGDCGKVCFDVDWPVKGSCNSETINSTRLSSSAPSSNSCLVDPGVLCTRSSADSRVVSSLWQSLTTTLESERTDYDDVVLPKGTAHPEDRRMVYDRRSGGFPGGSPRSTESSSYSERSSSWAHVARGEYIHDPFANRYLSASPIDPRLACSPYDGVSKRRLHTFATLGEGSSPALPHQEEHYAIVRGGSHAGDADIGSGCPSASLPGEGAPNSDHPPGLAVPISAGESRRSTCSSSAEIATSPPAMLNPAFRWEPRHGESPIKERIASSVAHFAHQSQSLRQTEMSPAKRDILDHEWLSARSQSRGVQGGLERASHDVLEVPWVVLPEASDRVDGMEEQREFAASFPSRIALHSRRDAFDGRLNRDDAERISDSLRSMNWKTKVLSDGMLGPSSKDARLLRVPNAAIPTNPLAQKSDWGLLSSNKVGVMAGGSHPMW